MPSQRPNFLAGLLSAQAIFVMVILGAIPIVWPIMSQYEGRALPVVKEVSVIARETVTLDDKRIALTVDMEFDKVRQCDFVGLYWFNEIGARVPLVFLQDEGRKATTRPVGDRQTAGPVLLVGITSLEKTRGVLESRCHPLWSTFTPFYP